MPQDAKDASTGRLLHFMTVPLTGRPKSYFYDEATREVTEAKAETALDNGDHVFWPDAIEHWIIRSSVLDGQGRPIIHADGRRIRTNIIKVISDNRSDERSEEILDTIWEDPEDREQGKGRGQNRGRGQE